MSYEAASNAVVKPPSRNWLGAYIEGILVPWSGFRFMKIHRSLWSYGVIPVILNFILSLLMGYLLYRGFGMALDWLTPYLPEGFFGGAVRVLAIVGLVLISVGVVIALWFLLGAVFCGYFYSRLARQVESIIGTPMASLSEVPLIYEIGFALRTAFLLIGINLLLLVLHIVPIVGTPLSVGLSFYYQCYLFGWEFFDYPLALRARSYRDKHRFAKGHRFHTLGMGASVLVFSFIPLLGPVFLTTAVVGSVLLHRRIEIAASPSVLDATR